MGCSIRRILRISEAIRYQEVKLFNKQNIDITNSCMYSWSSDSVCWTTWSSADDYNRICVNIESDFYLRILLPNDFGTIMIGDRLSNCYTISLDTSNNFLTNFCESPNLFQPYNNLDCALMLQSQISDAVICMFGIPVYYFQVNPDIQTRDYTFKEYFLHKVNSVKQIKLMIPDGQMPSSNPRLTEFDFDWQTDWETELSKTQFATAFGDKTYPKAGDFLYIPMMKRMWEVNAAYDEKNEGLMWQSTTWKLALVKYEDDSAVDVGVYEEILDNWTTLYGETLGKAEKVEQERLTGTTQIDSPLRSHTNTHSIFMEDYIRKDFTISDINIVDKSYNNKSVVVSRNKYVFLNDNGLITYQQPICGDCGTIMFILDIYKRNIGSITKNILSFGNIFINASYDDELGTYSISFGELTQELTEGSYMIFAKWNRRNFSTELCVYPYSLPENIPSYKIRPESYFFDYLNPVCEKIGVYNNDYIIRSPQECSISSYPFDISNIKYYNIYMEKSDSIKESVKYTTQHESCVINDLARPLTGGHGYEVK